MIHYALRCEHGHGFDGWFKDAASFEKQARRGLLECPNCASTKVDRALMAPAVASRKEAVQPPQPPAKPQPAAKAAGGPMPAELRAALQRLRAEVEKNCDYVGGEFADEARRMHAGDSDRRGIYGEATAEEAAALAEDGIDITRIPWVPRSDG